MLSNNTASSKPSMSSTQFLLSSFRYRVLALFDLQFILVTGKNRNNHSLTFGELINLADEHAKDYQALSEIWGDDNPILQPVKSALAYINLIESDIINRTIIRSDLVSEFAKMHPESARDLAIKITKSMKIMGDI